MKILRLSLFNLKKNKKEAFGIIFLTLVTTLMMCIFIANHSKSSKVFEESFKESGSLEYYVIFDKSVYRDMYRTILEEEYGAKDLAETDLIFATSTEVLEYDGSSISYNLTFLTEKEERKIEDFVKLDHLSDEEIANTEHPIWLPARFNISLGYNLKDTITILKGKKEYPFAVVGFYETGLVSTDGYGYKCIISDEDYELFTTIFTSTLSTEYVGLAFNMDDEFEYSKYIDRCEEKSFESIKNGMFRFNKMLEKKNETDFIELFLILIAGISMITLVSSLVMIMNKISNDIEEQMQQIGVLEALGYRSKEISLSYLLEYVITGGIGSVLGVISAILLTPLQDMAVRQMMGREIHAETEFGKMFIVAIAVMALVTVIALLKARSVKKYPPVIAFRKGIKTHHFGKNILPLEKTKGNINFRLAMKSLLMEIKGNIGIALTVIATGTAVIFAMMTFMFFKNGTEGLASMMGIDVYPLSAVLVGGVDPYALNEEIKADPEVKNSIVTYNLDILPIVGSDEAATCVVFDDYKNSEQITPFEGRCPEHDNEVMISVKRSDNENRRIGDSIVLECNGIKRSYIITGTVSSLYNGGNAVYLTNEGYERIDINARPNVLQIYLYDDVDYEKFEEKLLNKYGGGIKDKAASADNDKEIDEKIKDLVDEKISILMSQYGVTSLDYAVRIGDELITGNSRQFMIKDVKSFRGMAKSQMEPIAAATKSGTLVATFFIAFIVAMILIIIAGANVKRQRKNFGIMKSMGYSSKDLMKQIALKIVPVMVISMIIASVTAIYFNKFFWYFAFSTIAETDIVLVIAVDIVMILFAYLVTYIGAGKIRKISVTELMTE